MSEWLAFHIEAKGKFFDHALAAFKEAVPSTSRRWDREHRYWLFDPSFAEQVAGIASAAVKTAISLEDDDRRLGRLSVREDEVLDTALIDSQHGVRELFESHRLLSDRGRHD